MKDLKEVNVKGLTHFAHMERYVPHRTCKSYNMTFGGRCLNCGWSFDRVVDSLAPKAPEDQPA